MVDAADRGRFLEAKEELDVGSNKISLCCLDVVCDKLMKGSQSFCGHSPFLKFLCTLM